MTSDLAVQIENLEIVTLKDQIKKLKHQLNSLTSSNDKLTRQNHNLNKEVKKYRSSTASYREKAKSADKRASNAEAGARDCKNKHAEVVKEKASLERSLQRIGKLDLEAKLGEVEWNDTEWAIYRLDTDSVFLLKHLKEEYSLRVIVDSELNIHLSNLVPPPKHVVSKIIQLAKAQNSVLSI